MRIKKSKIRPCDACGAPMPQHQTGRTARFCDEGCRYIAKKRSRDQRSVLSILEAIAAEAA